MNPRSLLVALLLLAVLAAALPFLVPSRAAGAPSEGSLQALRTILQLVPLADGPVIAGPGTVEGNRSGSTGLLLRHGATNEGNLRAWLTLENTGEVAVRVLLQPSGEELLRVAPGQSATTDLLLGGSPQFPEAIHFAFTGDSGDRRFRYVFRDK